MADDSPRPRVPLVLVEELLDNIERLFKNIADPGICRGCGAAIFWVTHKNGRKTPYTASGLNHFIDCPKAKEFKR